MKKILIQLKKLFPTRYVTVDHIVSQHSFENSIVKEEYSVYIANYKLLNENTKGSELKTLKELDNYLNSVIDGYTKVYK